MAEKMQDPADLQRQIDALGPWFHNLHLPGGVQTVPNHFIGGDFPSFKWQQIRDHVPQDLSGWRVLDVGCNAGFYTFELARRGASVVAIDMEPLYLEQARWAARQYGLQDRVEFREQQVYDLARSTEQFDLVWFMGVFYHLRYPLLALDILAQRTRRMMVFQTLSMPGEEVYPDTEDHPITEREPLLDAGWPKMSFIEHRFSGDRTNWWVPNHAGIEAMLRSAGLRVTTRPAEEIYVCVPNAETAAWKWDTQLASVVGAAGVVPAAADAVEPGASEVSEAATA
jgi:tRNA (mo5U34)-methyltransferase